MNRVASSAKSRIESVFFFLPGDDHSLDELERLAQEGCSDGVCPERYRLELHNREDWFVQPLFDNVNDNRTVCGFDRDDVQVEVARVPRSVEKDKEKNEGNGKDTDWCRFLLLHRSAEINDEASLKEEIDRLNHLARLPLQISQTGPVLQGKSIENDGSVMTQFSLEVDAGGPAAGSSNSTLQPLGGVIGIFGERFNSALGTEYLWTPKSWQPDERWLWLMTECVPLDQPTQGIPVIPGWAIQQRDSPRRARSKLFFDIAGRKACVGRYATVLVDTRATDGRRLPEPQLQPELLSDFVHKWLASTLIVAMAQRTQLYDFSSKLAGLGSGDHERLGRLLDDVFAFRRLYWWEHLHRHPTAPAFNAFHDYHRLPSLMAQLSEEASDYYRRSQEESDRRQEESDRRQEESDRRISKFVVLLAIIAGGFGLIQVSSLSDFHLPYFLVGVGVSVMAIAAAMYIFLRHRHKR